jgi:hypothetical protein
MNHYLFPKQVEKSNKQAAAMMILAHERVQYMTNRSLNMNLYFFVWKDGIHKAAGTQNKAATRAAYLLIDK